MQPVANQARNRRTAVTDREYLIRDIPVETRRLSLAGVNTSVLEGGMGQPVLLLHGPAGNATHWNRVIPGLLGDCRVVVPDLPGHGNSEVQAGAMDAPHMVTWLNELIAVTCDVPPVLVGQTMGGAIALRYAAEYGSRLKHLVLVDAMGLAPFRPEPDFAAALNQYLTAPSSDTHQALWRLCTFDFDRMQESMGADWPSFERYNLDRAGTPSVLAAVVKLMEEIGAIQIPGEDLARIKSPTSLIWGRHDRATPLTVAEAAAERYGWKLHIVENAGDDPPIEQPEAVVRIVRAVIGANGR